MCIRGVLDVRNAEVVGGVIHHATLLRVTRIRLRRAEEDTIQRCVPAPRELPKALAVEMLPRPVRISPTRFRRPMAATKTFGHLSSDFGQLADEGINR